MLLSHPHRHPSRRFGPAVLGLALLATACSSSDETTQDRSAPGAVATSIATTTSTATAPSPTTAGTASTTSPTTPVTSATITPAPTAELTSAVRAFWDLYLAIGSSAEPFDRDAVRARLAERSTGASLERLLTYFASNASSGYVVRGAVEMAPTVVSVATDTAQVRDCYDDTTGLYRMSDGTRLDADNPLRHQVLMTLVREAGTWKVAAIADEGDGCTAAR